ncbi:MAG TPA: hypothetical protein VKU89_02050 [Solirubrobacteraceae bacterium]|nr:hypothetical protein [Solirubrobacteraceae bacterium]
MHSALRMRRLALLALLSATGLSLAIAPAIVDGRPAQRQDRSRRARSLALRSPARASASVTLARTKLGLVLVDGAGHTLYVFLRDRGGRSACYGACAKVWPPLLKGSGRLIAGRGISGGLLGVTHRRDGSTQITYHGRPLYTFSGDSSPREANGEGLQSFGGRWYALSAAGALVKPRQARGRA